MTSYFFIPASRLHKITAIQTASPGAIIIDFEDAILTSDIELFFQELRQLPNYTSHWYRIPVRNDFDEDLNLEYIKKFKDIGVQHMILPKLKSATELVEICDAFKSLKFIVLIEHPRLLLEMTSALINYPNLLKSLSGIGLGSHDLMTFLKGKHSDEQLDFPRKKVLYIAKAYDLLAIDIASMNITNQDAFLKEVSYGIHNGYDGKFIIHPKQLRWLKAYTTDDKSALDWAQSIVNHLPNNYNGESIEPFVLDGEVIEKPHALRAIEIIKKYNHGK